MTAPSPDVVDLWTADLDGAPAALARARATLDAAERARAGAILSPPARDRFVFARAALRTVLGAYLQVAAAQVPLELSRAGRPLLAGTRGLAFSLSHTGRLAVIAVTARPAIGVDIERCGRRISSGLMRRVLDEHELALVLATPAGRREEAFLRHWTVKEAYVKALGSGLSSGLRAVGVRDAATTPILAGAPGARWSVQRCDPRPGIVGAVVAAGGAWTARPRGPVAAAAGSV